MDMITRPPFTFWALLIHFLLAIYILCRDRDWKDSLNIWDKGEKPLEFSNLVSASMDSGSLFALGATLFDFLLLIGFKNYMHFTLMKLVFLPAAIIVSIILIVLFTARAVAFKLRFRNWPLTGAAFIASETIVLGLQIVCQFFLFTLF
ncbi:MAG: hypothetical protein RLZZ56_335 [Actinomycetota bacterium]|jgi:hypothetical protein